MTKRNTAIAIIGIIVIVLTFIIVYKNPGRISGIFAIENKQSAIVKSIKTVNGWGYEIEVNNKRFILQDFIPAIGGNQPFTTEAEALKCGELVKSKFKLGQMPSVTQHELDSIGITYNHLQN